MWGSHSFDTSKIYDIATTLIFQPYIYLFISIIGGLLVFAIVFLGVVSTIKH